MIYQIKPLYGGYETMWDSECQRWIAGNTCKIPTTALLLFLTVDDSYYVESGESWGIFLWAEKYVTIPMDSVSLAEQPTD